MTTSYKIAVKLTSSTYEKVHTRAKREGVSFSEMAARLVECGLFDYEESEKHDEPELTTVFVYGTLKRGYGNNRLLREGKSTFLCEATSATPNYSMTVRGVPFLSEGGTQHVKGELWEVDDKTLERLDRLEGHPDMYCRRQRWFRFASERGEKMLAWVYLVEYGKFGGERVNGEPIVWNPARGGVVAGA